MSLAAKDPTAFQQQIQRTAEALARAVSRYVDMMWAAFVVEKGLAPTRAHDPMTRLWWLEAPAEGSPCRTRAEVEAVVGVDLHVLARRYRDITQIDPAEACVRVVVLENASVVVEFCPKKIEGAEPSPDA